MQCLGADAVSLKMELEFDNIISGLRYKLVKTFLTQKHSLIALQKPVQN